VNGQAIRLAWDGLWPERLLDGLWPERLSDGLWPERPLDALWMERPVGAHQVKLHREAIARVGRVRCRQPDVQRGLSAALLSQREQHTRAQRYKSKQKTVSWCTRGEQSIQLGTIGEPS
jgi:hypothetical protein